MITVRPAKEVEEIMGGIVHEFPEDKINNAGVEVGITQGNEQGESKLVALVSKLLAAGRTADLEKCMTDKILRSKLYAEFTIS